MTCPGCKREVHDGAKFCPRCGTMMPRRKKGEQPVIT
ncbi:MAG: zinc ribbon domain-containing protein, partial [Muribaculaceae bacterium]|nr:zinc ribbon domain-containing protein [Muribaculaceae bacterium]